MNCLGCYIEVKNGYCLSCRKKLFNGLKVRPILDFDAPKPDNFTMFEQYSKRLSISGIQLKYSLRLEDGLLNLNESKGQYILKPVPPSTLLQNANEAPENEHLTMQIAAQLFNIDTALNALIYFEDHQPAYITKRFDVKQDGTKFMQEDFAQLSNRTKYSHGEIFKYDGSYEEIGGLIKRFVAAAMPTLENFFQLVVFNYVFSNGDAHLKNFSLIRNDYGEYRLSPAYDLMSTVIHTPRESDVALDLYSGDIDNNFYKVYGCYGRSNFMELAKRLGIIEKRGEKIIDLFLNKEPLLKKFVERSFLSEQTKIKYISNVSEKIKRLTK